MTVGKAVAGAGAWAWDQFGDQVKPGFLSFLNRKWEDAKEEYEKLRYTDTKWKKFNWGHAAERYKKHLQEIYGHIRVIGTTEPIPISDIFTDIYILDKPQAYHRFDITKLQEIQREPERLEFGLGNGKRTRGLKVVVSSRGKRLYILGKPGAGKTTFMKYLVHQTIIASELDKLPIFVTLREWNVLKEPLLDFITRQFKICNFPDARPFIEYILESGRALVLFDGLDEVPQESNQRDKTIEALHDFSKQYLDTQAIITCRVAASDYSFTEFTYIEMSDFNPVQVKTYAYNWFRNSAETAEDFLKELNLDENKGVRDLGRSPLLLSMICLAYSETMSIPKRRVDLYEEALDALLKKWDSSRKIKRDQVYKQLSLGYKRQMFAQIAADYFDKKEIFFPKKDIAIKIETYLNSLPPDSQNDSPDGESILEAISAQHGILVERARGLYSFSHLTFQEYYSAKYIADNANRGTLERLAAHLNDSRWREVFLLTASLLPEAKPLFEAIQNAAQRDLQGNLILLAIQTWVIRRATGIPAFKKNAKRTLYWFISLNLVFSFHRDRILRLVHALSAPPHVDIRYSILGPARNLALDLALDLDRDLARILDRDFARDLDLSRFNLEDGLDLDRALAQYLPPQAHDSLDIFYFDLITTYLVQFAYIFASLPKKERSKERIGLFQNYLKTWQAMPGNPPIAHEAISCPAYLATDREWQSFKNTVYGLVEKLLDVDLSQSWTGDDYVAASKYLRANQLFWDCLQVSRLEDREAVEDMILALPKDN